MEREGFQAEPITISGESEDEQGAKVSVSRADDTIPLSNRAFGVALRKTPRVFKNTGHDSPKSRVEAVAKKEKVEVKKRKKRKGKEVPKGSDKRINRFVSNSEGKPRHGNCDDTFPDDFKLKLSMEIKQQVLGGLGIADKDALQNVQIDVEDLCPIDYRKEGLTIKNDSPLQHYMANVKLVAIIRVPVAVQAQEPQESHKQDQEQEANIMDKGILQQQKEVNDTEELDLVIKEKKNYVDTDHEKAMAEDASCEDELAVADPRFYDFDSDRNEDKFAEGQVWAMYDKPDGMPRFYVKLEKVISINPFKVRVSSLQLEVGPTSCNGKENVVSCGVYRLNRSTICEHVNFFSHLTKWEETQAGQMAIYPGAGEVWALYKNWEEFDLSKRVKAGYEIVRVRSADINKAKFSVVMLMKDENFDTVFREPTMKKPMELFDKDIMRFSHRILIYEVKGLEGCFELDPASTPS